MPGNVLVLTEEQAMCVLLVLRGYTLQEDLSFLLAQEIERAFPGIQEAVFGPPLFDIKEAPCEKGS